MARLRWDEIGSRSYENGISQGVFYKRDGYGVPWNGLTAVEETVSNETEQVYFDGQKINDIVTLGDYGATLRAFTYPDELTFYEGVWEDQQGFYITGQQQTQFGLSYRTERLNDIGHNTYKIHLLYNLIAIPDDIQRQTIGDNADPVEFSWTLSSIPEQVGYFRPTSHVIIDSEETDPYLLADLESILYGGEDSEARLPPLSGIATYIRKWDRLIVIDNGDGTWTASSTIPGIVEMTDQMTFQIVHDNAVYLDEISYTLTSSDKNEEDLWPL
jgi:hypothetical protein